MITFLQKEWKPTTDWGVETKYLFQILLDVDGILYGLVVPDSVEWGILEHFGFDPEVPTNFNAFLPVWFKKEFEQLVPGQVAPSLAPIPPHPDGPSFRPETRTEQRARYERDPQRRRPR